MGQQLDIRRSLQAGSLKNRQSQHLQPRNLLSGILICNASGSGYGLPRLGNRLGGKFFGRNHQRHTLSWKET